MTKKSLTEMQESPTDIQNSGNTANGKGEETTLATFRVPTSLHRRFKAHAALTGRTNQEIFVELIRAYLEEVEKAG